MPGPAVDFYLAYLGGVVDVVADAEAFVVGADVDYSEVLGGVGGEAVEVEAADGFLLGDVFHFDGEVAGDDFVDCVLYVVDFFLGGGLGEVVVEFAFFAFDVGFDGAAAVVVVVHGAVDDVFGGVHGWVFFFVVVVEHFLCVFLWLLNNNRDSDLWSESRLLLFVICLGGIRTLLV